MLWRKGRVFRKHGGFGARQGCAPGRFSALTALALSLSFAALPAWSQAPLNPLRLDKVDDVTPVNQLPDANAQMALRDRGAPESNFSALNAERRRQIAEESARLMKLAGELKDEVEKSARNTLSLAQVRKAGEIERLAHSVKEKMKLTSGAN